MSASDSRLSNQHEEVTEIISETIKPTLDEDGKKVMPPAAYIANAIKWLAYNKIEATRDNAKLKKLASLVDSLPFTDGDEHGLAN